MKSLEQPAARASATCLMVGPFPPPIFGSAVVTAALRDVLLGSGYKIREINSAGSLLLHEKLSSRILRRLRISSRLLRELARHNKRTSVYISYAGGGGQFGDLLNVLLARLFCCPIAFHHHSFAYIRTPRRLTRWVFAAAGKRARHIFLCGDMRRQAMQHYRSVQRGYVLSNAALVELPYDRPHHPRPLQKIGFFSNITMTKGIDRFLELARRLRASGSALAFEAAGPCRDELSRQMVEAATGEGLISYQGGLDGDEKLKFFDAIDVLVLPSRYPHETEPIVILEALAAGIPVIATDRGCIAELIGRRSGCLLDPDADDLDLAVRQIAQWIAQPEAFAEASHEAVARGLLLRDTGRDTLKILMRHIAWRPALSKD